MSYWLADNRDQAEGNVLHMVKGYLKWHVEHGENVSAEEILRYIEKSVKEEEERLDTRFPQYSRAKEE